MIHLPSDQQSNSLATHIGLRGVAGVLPPRSMTLEELARAGLIHSAPEVLHQFGFTNSFVASPEHDAGWLAKQAARDALQDANLQSEDVDLLIWASAIPRNHLRIPSSAPSGPLNEFRYAAGWLQEELGLDRAEVMAVTQQGCATMFSALRAARSLLVAEPRLRNILCIGVDVLPPGSPREIMYNLISDAACAVVVSRDCAGDCWIDSAQISRGYYWDIEARQAEIIAAYFPDSRRVIEQLLEGQKLSPQAVDMVVPTGVNRNSWEILMRLIAIPSERLYRSDLSFGHTISADSFLYLQEIRRQNRLARGARVLLFSYGFGSTWCSLLLEH
jgi:3-oxoacyl-[acyl-carrier-protein] synthase III